MAIVREQWGQVVHASVWKAHMDRERAIAAPLFPRRLLQHHNVGTPLAGGHGRRHRGVTCSYYQYLCIDCFVFHEAVHAFANASF